MKSIINKTSTEQEIKAPCLLKVVGEPKEKEYVLFLISESKDFYEGFVIWSAEQSSYKVGFSSCRWIKAVFELFDGTISLSN